MKKLLVILLVTLGLLLSSCEEVEETVDFKIMFETNGGTEISDITTDGTSLIQMPASPTKEGHTFNGWYLDDNTFTNAFTAESILESKVTHNITVYAKWEANTYELRFFDDDGSLLKKHDVVYDTQLSSSLEPTEQVEQKVGHTFHGWDIELPSSMPAHDVDLTATYEINTYTVSYVDYDGTILYSEDIEYGANMDDIAPPEEPTRLGYTFDSWSDYLPLTMPANDIEINADYYINSYYLKFYDVGDYKLHSELYNYGDDLSNANPPMDISEFGYTFLGWDIPDTMPATDLELYPILEANEHTLTLLDDDETVIETITVAYDTLLSDYLSDDPIKEGHTFTGWEGLWRDTMPNDDLTLTAQYEINTYDLIFYDDDGTLIATNTYDYGTPLIDDYLIDNPSKEGYLFTGWDQVLPNTMPADDLELTAQYDIGTYTLSYLDYDGTVIQSETFTYEADLSGVTEPDAQTREGHTFTQWEVLQNTTMPGEDIDLYAQYTINKYTVTFLDTDGTTLKTYDVQYNREFIPIFTDFVSPDPNLAGHVFTGWDPVLPTHMPAHDITVTATYLAESYNTGMRSSHMGNYESFIKFSGDHMVYIEDGYLSPFEIHVQSLSDPTDKRIISLPNSDDMSKSTDQLHVYGDYIIHNNSSYNNYEGAVFIYKLSDPTYERIITSNQPTIDRMFGDSIVLEGDYLVVEVPGYGDAQGAIYVYKLSDPTYQRHIVGTNTDDYDQFAINMKVQGDYLFVWAPGYNDGEGAIFVYKFSDETYERVITNPDPTVNGQLYMSQIHGDYIIARTFTTQTEQAKVHIYRISDETYIRTLTGTNTTIGDHFGFRIKLQNDYILISAIGYNNTQGAVFVYQFSDETYERVITASDGSESDRLIIDSIHNDYIITRAIDYNDNQSAIYLYKLSDPTYERKIVGSNTKQGSNFGRFIYISDDHMVITSSDEPELYLYKFSDETYERIIPGFDIEQYDNYGYNALIDGNYLIVSANRYKDNQGIVFIYDITNETYERRFSGTDATTDHQFGNDLFLHNNYLIVTSTYPIYGFTGGAIYVYDINDSQQ